MRLYFVDVCKNSDDFRNFARVCFQEFGDKVDMWITFNEPYIYSVAGYDKGNKAMGRCSKWVNSLCVAGDSSIEPYLVSHHLLLAHAAAVDEFRNCDKVYYLNILKGCDIYINLKIY